MISDWNFTSFRKLIFLKKAVNNFIKFSITFGYLISYKKQVTICPFLFCREFCEENKKDVAAFVVVSLPKLSAA